MSTTQTLVGGRYELRRLLGAGGFAEVWLAEDHQAGQKVALKLPRGRRSNLAGAAPSGHRELAAAQRLEHPHIVRVLGSGEEAGDAYLVMEYVEGPNLRERLATGPLATPELAALSRELSSALAHAHGRGILHNDIKPENVLLGRDGAKLADFGAAAGVETTLATRSAGDFAATLAYIAPEVLQGERPTVQSDVYALALVLFEAASGRLPWSGTGAAVVAAQRLAGPARSLREVSPAVPGAFAAAVDRGLSLDPQDRFRSVSEFQNAAAGASPTVVLAEMMGATPQPTRAARPRRALAAATAVVGSVVFGAGLLSIFERDAGGAGGLAPTTTAVPFGVDRMLAQAPTATPTAVPPEPTVVPTQPPASRSDEPPVRVVPQPRGNGPKPKDEKPPNQRGNGDDDDD